MIKHEEIKTHIDLSMMTRHITNGLYFALEQYIEQQQKKDMLLELYKEYFQIVERGDNDWHYRMNEIPEQIKALEEELK